MSGIIWCEWGKSLNLQREQMANSYAASHGSVFGG